jgi:hypothetical protein
LRLRIGDIVKALVAGAASGGLTTGMETYLVMFVFGPFGLNPPPTPATIAQAIIIGLSIIPVATVVAGLVFMIGLAIVGLPAWAALHALGFRSRWFAVLAGSVLAPAPIWAGGSWEVGAPAFSWVLLGLVLPGAVAGWTLHRIAYGGPKPA